jgi:hypothetical protein
MTVLKPILQKHQPINGERTKEQPTTHSPQTYPTAFFHLNCGIDTLAALFRGHCTLNEVESLSADLEELPKLVESFLTRSGW